MAITAGEDIGIGAFSAFEKVVALATREDVATAAALQPVIARPAIKVDCLARTRRAGQNMVVASGCGDG